jgi:gas vesicle protein
MAALLLAPQSGQDSREQLRGYARRGEDAVREFAGRAAETWNQAVEKGREFVEEQKSVLGDALQAGREAMRRERERD